MCGIAAIFHYADSSGSVDTRELLQIRDHMARRGPDGCGLWISSDKQVGLAHRRLSIIDLSDSASQPMRTPDERFHIVFNGEIYNYRQLRSDLEKQGHRFVTSSDTEVILRAFQERGVQMLTDLRGMFAIAIWDDRTKTLFLGRDPYGIKPLYYALGHGSIRVASQVKALLAGGGVSRDPDPTGIEGFFSWGSVPEPYTLFRAIQQVPAGSYLEVSSSGTQGPVPYWSPKNVFSQYVEMSSESSHEGAVYCIPEAVRESVGVHLESDVPVGVFLSAGIDSSVMAALSAQASNARLKTVCLVFEDHIGTPLDESTIAAETARFYGTDHTTITVTQSDFYQAFDDILEQMDQPTIDGVNTYFVARAAAQAGLKVAISGLGGDELFGGYDTFSQVPRIASLLSTSAHVPLLHRTARALVRVSTRRGSPKLRGVLEYGSSLAGAYFVKRGLFMPWELGRLINPDLIEDGVRLYKGTCDAARHVPAAPSFFQVACLEQSMYMRNQLLRDADWAGMAHSVEIRVPLVDRTLTERLASVCGAAGAERLHKRSLALSPREPLPSAVLGRRKTGFSVPMGKWLNVDSDVRGLPPARSWAQAVYAEYSQRGQRYWPPAAGLT